MDGLKGILILTKAKYRAKRLIKILKLGHPKESQHVYLYIRYFNPHASRLDVDAQFFKKEKKEEKKVLQEL